MTTTTWSIPTFTGSPKQVAWATQIAQDALANLDNAQAYIDKMVNEYDYADDGENAAQGYTSAEIAEVRSFVQDLFDLPKMHSAAMVIDNRSGLSYDALVKMMQSAFSLNLKWDRTAHQWIKR